MNFDFFNLEVSEEFTNTRADFSVPPNQGRYLHFDYDLDLDLESPRDNIQYFFSNQFDELIRLNNFLFIQHSGYLERCPWEPVPDGAPPNQHPGYNFRKTEKLFGQIGFDAELTEDEIEEAMDDFLEYEGKKWGQFSDFYMPANTAAMVLIYLEKLLDLTSEELIRLELLDKKYNSRKGKKSIIDGLIYHPSVEANLNIQLSPAVASLLFEV